MNRYLPSYSMRCVAVALVVAVCLNQLLVQQGSAQDRAPMDLNRLLGDVEPIGKVTPAKSVMQAPVVTPYVQAPKAQAAPTVAAPPVVAPPVVAPPVVAPVIQASVKPVVKQQPKIKPAVVKKSPAKPVKKPAPPFKLGRNQVMAMPRQQPWDAEANKWVLSKSEPLPAPKKLRQTSATTKNYRINPLDTMMVNQAYPEAQPLTLESALGLAFTNELGLMMARLQVDKAQHAKRQAYSALLPNIILNYQHSRFQGGIQVFDGDPNQAYISTIRPEIRAELPINLGGRDLFTIKEKAAQVAAKSFLADDLEQSTLAAISDTYMNLLEQYLKYALSDQTQKEAQQQLKLSQARFDEGVGVLIEVLESRSQLESEQRSQLNYERVIAQLSAQLARQLGLDEGQLLRPDLSSALDFSFVTTPQLLTSVNTPAAAGRVATLAPLYDRAISQSYDVKQAMKNVEASKQKLKATIANLAPTVKLSSYVNLIGNRTDNLISSRYAGFELNLDLLEGLGVKRVQQIKQAQIDAKLAALELEQVQRKIRAQVAEQFTAWQTAKRQRQLAWTQLATSEAARAQATGRYEEGVGNYLEVLRSATDLETSRTNLVTLTLEEKRAELALALALSDLKPRLASLINVQLDPPNPVPNPLPVEDQSANQLKPPALDGEMPGTVHLSKKP